MPWMPEGSACSIGRISWDQDIIKRSEYHLEMELTCFRIPGLYTRKWEKSAAFVVGLSPCRAEIVTDLTL